MINPNKPSPIHIQEVVVPGNDNSNIIPEAIPAGRETVNRIRFGDKPIEKPRRVTNIPLAATTGEGMITELNHMKMKNQKELMKLKIMIQAYDAQMESYRVIHPTKYQEALEQKLQILDKHQVLNYEQNLVLRELKFLTKQEQREQGKQQKLKNKFFTKFRAGWQKANHVDY